MNHKTRRVVETLACERRYGIADAKGAEYSGAGQTYKETGADTLANFKAVGERVGTTPEQALMVYLLKHIDSINTTVREAAEFELKKKERVLQPNDLNSQEIYAKGEGIVSRLDDARNYLDLLECLLIDNAHIAEHQPQSWETAEKIGAVYDDYEGLSTTEVLVNEFEKDALVKAGLVEASEGVWCSPQSADDGMILCLDGVRRPPAVKDESVKNPGERQTPIYCQPTVFEPETGELDA